MREPTEKSTQTIIGALRGNPRRAWTINGLSSTLGIDKKSVEVILNGLVEDKKVARADFGKYSKIFLWAG